MSTAGKEPKMRRVFLFISLSVFLLGSRPALGTDELTHILEGIRNRYSPLPGLSISYTREVITGTMSMLGNQVRGESATGQIYFKPPHFLRLEQEIPKPETIISNGDTLWWYIPEKKLAHQYSSKGFGKEMSILTDIFRGLTQVEEKFKVALLGRNEQGEYQIELTPNPTWEQVDRIVITVTSGHEIRVVDSRNMLGTITKFTLEGLKPEESFKKDFFQFIVPPGVQLVHEGDQ
jgi:outer membrane lipoprotein-sorting protein